MRGQWRSGYIHVCDWYATLLPLAGADPVDNHPGVPPVDGLDMWGYLMGKVRASPRTEMMLSNQVKNGVVKTAALIVGDYKLILGTQLYGFWQGPVYPNASTDHENEPSVDCVAGCLFNIQKDQNEQTELSKQEGARKQQLMDRYTQLNATTFEAPAFPLSPQLCAAYLQSHQGFLGPYYTSNVAVAAAAAGVLRDQGCDEDCDEVQLQ